MKKILITGAAGFIGHHVVEHFLKEDPEVQIFILDRLDDSGNPNRITDIERWDEFKPRVHFVWWDLKARLNEIVEAQLGTDFEYIFHLAAGSHVDRSIADPLSFVMDNCVGTANILDFARRCPQLKAFFNFSTDEVFGPAPLGYFHKETDPYHPSNPYSASKAGAASLGYAFFKTYGLPVITTYTMNVFGERQHPEKLIPMVIRSVLSGTPAIIHGAPGNIGSRVWIHARNVAAALLFLTQKGVPGEAYNVIGFDEIDNLTMAEKIAAVIGKPLQYELVDFHKTRPGHDRRYALDGAKLRDLGFVPPVDFESSLRRTVEWEIDHPEWLGIKKS